MEEISIKKKIFFYVILIIVLLIFFEIICRIFWVIKYDVPFFKMSEIIYVFYPEVQRVKSEYTGDNKSILLMVASVLDDDFGRIEYWIREKMKKYNFAIYNVSTPAHTSLDTYYKYLLLKNIHFDAIVFYHGINETRANNCPKNIFRDDYSHYAWYFFINNYFKHKEISFFVMPYTINYVLFRIMDKLNIIKWLTVNYPYEDWIKYGGDIKTEKSFSINLHKIYKLNKIKEDGIIICPTFVLNKTSYVNTNCKYAYPIRIWGLEKNVRKGVQVHNSIIYAMGKTYDKMIVIDMSSVLIGDSTTMVDICHFTNKGSKIFAEVVCDTIIKYIEK